MLQRDVLKCHGKIIYLDRKTLFMQNCWSSTWASAQLTQTTRARSCHACPRSLLSRGCVHNARRSVNQSSCWPALDTTSPRSCGLWVGTQRIWVGLGRFQEGRIVASDSKCLRVQLCKPCHRDWLELAGQSGMAVVWRSASAAATTPHKMINTFGNFEF